MKQRIDLAALGYTTGDAIFSAHVVANDNADIEFDEWYIGPASSIAGTVAISTPAELKNQLVQLKVETMLNC